MTRMLRIHVPAADLAAALAADWLPGESPQQRRARLDAARDMQEVSFR